MEYYVYILRSLKNDSFYKGSTSDLVRRFEEHNAGTNKSTSRYAPWKLEWSTKVNTRAEAIQLEKKLKNITSRARLEDFIARHSKAHVL